MQATFSGRHVSTWTRNPATGGATVQARPVKSRRAYANTLARRPLLGDAGGPAARRRDAEMGERHVRHFLATTGIGIGLLLGSALPTACADAAARDDAVAKPAPSNARTYVIGIGGVS